MALGMTLGATGARADTCVTPIGADPKLAAIDGRARIDFLHRTLEEQAHYATLWKWWWVGIGSATVTWSLVQAAGWSAGDDVRRQTNVTDDLIVAAFSAVTPVATLLFSPRVASDAPVVDALLAQTSGGAAGTCLVVARIEELFEKGADEEARNTGVLVHLAGVLGVGAMFSILGVEAAEASNPTIRVAHWENAIVSGVGGLLLTQAQILTRPTGSVSAYRRYLRGELPPAPSAVSLTIVPMSAALGVSVRLSF
jgi:hypothetical protein